MTTRAIVFVLLGWAALIVESALAAVLPGARHFVVAPELALFVVFYLGLCGRGEVAGLCASALVIGYLRDLYVGAPRGVEALAFCVVALVARAMHGRVFLERFGQLAVVAVAMTLLHGMLVAMLGTDVAFNSSLRSMPASLVSALVTAPIVLRLLQQLDHRLVPEVRALEFGGGWR